MFQNIFLLENFQKIKLIFFSNEIFLHFGVPNNQILLQFGVPNNQILLHFCDPDN